jgi:hypothetical protein
MPRLNAFRSSRVIIRRLCRRSATTVYQYRYKVKQKIEREQVGRFRAHPTCFVARKRRAGPGMQNRRVEDDS